MVLTPLVAKSALGCASASDKLVDFVIYETSDLGVIYRWGNFKSTYSDFRVASKNHLGISFNLNSKLKENYSRPCKVFNGHLQTIRKNGRNFPIFLITQS